MLSHVNLCWSLVLVVCMLPAFVCKPFVLFISCQFVYKSWPCSYLVGFVFKTLALFVSCESCPYPLFDIGNIQALAVYNLVFTAPYLRALVGGARRSNYTKWQTKVAPNNQKWRLKRQIKKNGDGGACGAKLKKGRFYK